MDYESYLELEKNILSNLGLNKEKEAMSSLVQVRKCSAVHLFKAFCFVVFWSTFLLGRLSDFTFTFYLAGLP